jgi:hypothetical protein
MTARVLTLRDDLRVQVATVLATNRRLEVVITAPTRRPSAGVKHGRVDHSQPPWNSPVAYLITDLHARSRELETGFRVAAGVPVRLRGGSEGNTEEALTELAALAAAVPDPDVARALGWLESWVARALVALGVRDQPRRLPRQPQEPEPRCPYCLNHTLRFWASRGEVRCVNPDCRDDAGQRPAAAMEYSNVTQDWVLAWRDGGVGVAA